MIYLTGSLLILLIWLLIFLFFKRLRREMLVASILITPAGFTELYFVPDYWLPDALWWGQHYLSSESFIFPFAVGGIAAVSYELFAQKHLRHYRLNRSFKAEIMHAAILGVAVIICFWVYYQFKINFMYATYISMIIGIFLIILQRPDLIKKVIYTGLIFGLFYTVFFITCVRIFAPNALNFWNLANISGIIIIGIPLEEIIWAIGTGALIGPLYEYLLSIKLVTVKK